MSIKHKFLVFFSCAFLLFSCGKKEREKGLPEGEIAPNFTATDVLGNIVELKNYKGKLVMLYFWADYCPACKKEFPQTQAYYEKLKGENFELLAINVGQKPESSLNFKEKYQVTFPMILDEQKNICKMYGVEKLLPVNYFISPDGKILRRILGWVDENQVKVIINQLKK